MKHLASRSTREHRIFGARLAIALLAGLSTIAQGADQDSKFNALPKGQPVIAPGVIEGTRAKGAFGSIEPAVIEGRPGATVRVPTTTRPENSYSLQLRVPTSAAVRKGAKLLAVFDGRAVEPQSEEGLAQTEFVFEQVGAPYAKSASHPVKLTRGWQRFYLPFEVKHDHEAGRAAVIFRAGYDPQVIEISGVQVLDYGPDFPREKLPYTPGSYAGREPDAPWRQQALERIDRIRKADLTVTVTDPAGKPVAGAKVRAQLKRQAFGWGTAVDAKNLLGNELDNQRYREVLLQNFNKAVLENDLKWGAWSEQPQRALEALAWMQKLELPVRGHVLLWPGKANLPTAIHPLLGHPDKLRDNLLEHIREQATAVRGRVVEWDVVNEPFTNFDVQAALSGVPREAGADWIERHASTLVPFFRAARAADPDATLYINDYSILETGGRDHAHQDHYERTIRQLLAEGAPVQGIGIQGHFSEDLTPIPKLWTILDRFAKFGLPIQITEFDVNTQDEALQADYTRDFLTAMFAHESINAVLIWGFWEKRHWIPEAAYYRADWSLRPAGQVWLDLVQKEWRTDAEGVTDARGGWKVRGFHGDYEITVQSGDRSATGKAVLGRDAGSADIRLQ